MRSAFTVKKLGDVLPLVRKFRTRGAYCFSILALLLNDWSNLKF